MCAGGFAIFRNFLFLFLVQKLIYRTDLFEAIGTACELVYWHMRATMKEFFDDVWMISFVVLRSITQNGTNSLFHRLDFLIFLNICFGINFILTEKYCTEYLVTAEHPLNTAFFCLEAMNNVKRLEVRHTIWFLVNVTGIKTESGKY